MRQAQGARWCTAAQESKREICHIIESESEYLIESEYEGERCNKHESESANESGNES